MLQKVKSFFSSIKKQTRSEKQLVPLNQKTKICKICFKEIKEATFHNLLNKEVFICHNCLLELQPTFTEFKIGSIKALALYPYNEKVQGVLYQYKGCSDFVLKDIFLEYYTEYLKMRFHNFIMIPAPSSKESYEQRGFHHVEEMFSCLGLNIMNCIHKIDDIKQHELKSKDRSNIKNNLYIDDVDFSIRKVLIVDDVYTTGATVKSMIELIKTKNAKKIAVLVMSKTIDLDKRL